jgi:hypothetical protein
VPPGQSDLEPAKFVPRPRPAAPISKQGANIRSPASIPTAPGRKQQGMLTGKHALAALALGTLAAAYTVPAQAADPRSNRAQTVQPARGQAAAVQAEPTSFLARPGHAEPACLSKFRAGGPSHWRPRRDHPVPAGVRTATGSQQQGILTLKHTLVALALGILAAAYIVPAQAADPKPSPAHTVQPARGQAAAAHGKAVVPKFPGVKYELAGVRKPNAG